MIKLNEVLPTKSATVEAIESYWKQRGDSEPRRGYLGGSAIGKECSRELWYSFRFATKPNFDGRLYRLFNRGHREENTFVEELRGIGCEVHEFDADGNQFEVIDCDGHFKGHTDGAALGIPEAPKTWHLLEMKTASNSQFNEIKKEGCEVAKPEHFAQQQVYMRGTGLTRSLYMVVNKDTDELYTERLRYDSKRAQSYIDKASYIIDATTPPEKADTLPKEGERAKYGSPCTYCDAKSLCHGTTETAVAVPDLSCRQCVHATPMSDGKWACKANGDAINVCKDHLFLPGFINFAQPTDSLKNPDGSLAIEFTSDDGTVWQHGPDANAGQYSSHDLMTLPRSLILPGVAKPAPVEGVTGPNLEARYALTLDNVVRVWSGSVEDLLDVFTDHYHVPMSNPNAEQEGDGWSAAEFAPHCCVIVFSGGTKAEIREDGNIHN